MFCWFSELERKVKKLMKGARAQRKNGLNHKGHEGHKVSFEAVAKKCLVQVAR
jgi:hypothetical protein